MRGALPASRPCRLVPRRLNLTEATWPVMRGLIDRGSELLAAEAADAGRK